MPVRLDRRLRDPHAGADEEVLELTGFTQTVDRPGLSQHEAEDLARLLELGRNVAALELAGRIRQQARLDSDQPPASTDIELERVDLGQIAQVFVDGPDLLTVLAFDHLNREVLAALGRA